MDDLDVLVIGRSCVDHLAVVERFPEEDRKVPLDVRMTEGGGQGGTSSCCISRLGGRVAYVGRLGDDEGGRFCRRRLADFGVAADHVSSVAGGKTPVAYVFVTRANGNRTIIYERNELPRLTDADIPDGLLRRAKVVLLDPETTYLCEAIQARLGSETAVVYDCERWREGMEAMMATADYFVPSFEFLYAPEWGDADVPFAGRMAKIHRRIRGRLIVTHGRTGAYYMEGRHILLVHAPSVPVKDTVGAGDNFHAAFALAVARGFDLPDAVRFSVAVASLSCREYGGREGIPDFDEAIRLSRRLESRRIL